VVLTRGNDRFTGDSMTYDNLSRELEMKGRVHGMLMPAPAATSPRR
jgi:lipopolysaccharide export system protein LptC